MSNRKTLPGSNRQKPSKGKITELLLALSEDLAKVMDREHLIGVIKKRLKALISFSDLEVALYHPEKRAYSIFNNIRPHKSEYQESSVSQDFPIDDGIHNAALAATGPLVINLRHHLQHAAYNERSQYIYESGIREMLLINLMGSEEVLGFLTIYSDAESGFSSIDFTILKGIADQLASAVHNVLAVEEIRRREEDKTLLLSFSNDIASARDKAGLRPIIKKYLRNLFLIREYIITIKNDDSKTYAYFLHDISAEEPSDEGFAIITGPGMPVEGSLTGATLASDTPVIFDIEEIIREKKYSFPSASFWRSANAKKILGVRLRVADEDVGILWVQPYQISESLMKGISAQIAIAIANTVANERITAQLTEINNYKQQLFDEKIYLQEEAGVGYSYSDIIGTGVEMQKVFLSLSQVTAVSSTVLLLGETGTGKELIARAIHNSSSRKDMLMVKVNCAALPASLIESELFGHERGSFTGATERRIGKFELANKGTLFLDEIGEMPLDLQVKLLRAIQEKEIERVGGKATIKTDVRLIAATNRNLQKEVDEGRFRRDLFYRLNVFPIILPPLRDRKDDIPILAAHFLEKYSKNAGKLIRNISGKAMKQLMSYSWPGNVREMEHLIERSILITKGEVIREMHLPDDKTLEIKHALEDEYIKTFEENERDHIIDVLQKCNGKIFGPGGAAEILRLNVSTLNSKIKKLNIGKGTTFFVKPAE